MANVFAKILGPRGGRPFRPTRPRPRPRFRAGCDPLESRELLSGLGTDYTLMGGQWDSSRPISYSIAPDGVGWDQGLNDVNASLDAEYGGTGWQSLVARALQTWAAATNLNFTPAADGPYAFNAPGVNQGDPLFGDIRVGGYNFGNSSTIARTYGPPPNGQTAAGDVELNTGFNFGPGSDRDLETVLIHEVGHSLGLGESPQPGSVMYSYYQGVRQSLSAYDVEGIQSIYGARQPDVYQGEGLATSPATALNLSPLVNAYGQAQLGGLGLQTIGDVEYFSVVAPPKAGATLDVAAIAAGFSLLSPKISVIDPSTGATLASSAHPTSYGDNALASVPGVQAGHRYLIAVAGATGDVFSVGSYGIGLGFFGGTSTAPPPDPYAYNNTFASATELGANSQATLLNLTLPSALEDQVFTFESTQPGTVMVGTLGAEAVVGDARGQVVAEGSGLLSFAAGQPGRYYVITLATDGQPVGAYDLAVRTPLVAPAELGGPVVPPTPVANLVEAEATTSPKKAARPSA